MVVLSWLSPLLLSKEKKSKLLMLLLSPLLVRFRWPLRPLSGKDLCRRASDIDVVDDDDDYSVVLINGIDTIQES